MRIRIYTIAKRQLLVEYNVRSSYESTFYHRNMPTLSAKRCRQILDTVSPHFKVESELFAFENVIVSLEDVEEKSRIIADKLNELAKKELKGGFTYEF